MDYKQVLAIKARQRQRILAECPTMRNTSGIYVWERRNESGYLCWYVGQSVHLVDRSISHIQAHDHLGLSVYKHGLSHEKDGGWQLKIITYCDQTELNDLETKYIAEYMALPNSISYNVTSGSQGVGKHDINETQRKPPKGYYDGKAWQLRHDRQELAKLFNGKLKVVIDGKETAVKRRALEKFTAFITLDDGETGETK